MAVNVEVGDYRGWRVVVVRIGADIGRERYFGC